MNRRLVKSMLVGAAAATASVAFAVSATAAPQQAADNAQGQSAAAHAGAHTTSEQKSVKEYWTPERMRAATPLDKEKPSDAKSAMSTSSDATATSTTSATATRMSTSPKLGKVFFTMNGSDYVCSGTVVHSANHDVVTTAGHCVNDGSSTFASKFAFVPAYNNGSAPYGTWTAKRLYTTSRWSSSSDFNYDAGFAVMNNNSSGHSISYITGSYGIAFNQSRGLTYRSYGYPAASPYTGQYLYSCYGKAHNDTHSGALDQGIPCTMTGGSSGGGWIESGYLNSVNSYKYDSDPNTMYGPYFGTTIKNTYTSAANY